MSIISERLGGVSEVAAELGVTRQQVAKLRQRDDFPAPLAGLAAGEIWDLDIIRRWAGSGVRRKAGRPSLRSSGLAIVGRRFALGMPIADGGFGLILSAQDLAAPGGPRIAVKVLLPGLALDPEIAARFGRELDLMSRLSHPNVMSVLASGTDAAFGLWYAMPLALGSLADDLHTQMDQDAILAVMRDICAGLAYIHGNGILHRDLKPQNVLRTQHGTWAVADFGLARSVAETSARITGTAESMGTPFYTAPEQWKDAKRVTEAADIYSAGKILQAMLIGGTPADDSVPPGKLAPVIRRATSQRPERRHATAAELLAAIETAHTAPAALAKQETSPERASRLRQRLSTLFDAEAAMEIIRWADEAGPEEAADFAQALSAMPAEALTEWWEHDSEEFTRAFLLFAGALDTSFPFAVCDLLADFARRAVTVTRDQIVLHETIRGLAILGYKHNRWHVRDIVVRILQEVQDDEHAVSALEALRIAGPAPTEWTVGNAAANTLHPILRSGMAQFLNTVPD